MYVVHMITYSLTCVYCVCGREGDRGSRSLQNLVAISQKYCQPLLTIKTGCMGSNGKIGYSIQKVVAKVKDEVANG